MNRIKKIFKKPWIDQAAISVCSDDPEVFRCFFAMNEIAINLFIHSFCRTGEYIILRYNEFAALGGGFHFENAQTAEQTFYIFNGKRDKSEYAAIIEESFPKDIFSHGEILKDIKSQTVIVTLYQTHESLELCCQKEVLPVVMDSYMKTLFSESGDA